MFTVISMKDPEQNSPPIRWVARIMSMVFAVFISIFSLDVFTENYSFWNGVLALFMHLIPALLVLLVLLVSWRREWFGGATYTLLGIIYLVTGKEKMDWAAYLLIAGPLFILGILFFLAWLQKKQQKSNV